MYEEYKIVPYGKWEWLGWALIFPWVLDDEEPKTFNTQKEAVIFAKNMNIILDLHKPIYIYNKTGRLRQLITNW